MAASTAPTQSDSLTDLDPNGCISNSWMISYNTSAPGISNYNFDPTSSLSSSSVAVSAEPRSFGSVATFDNFGLGGEVELGMGMGMRGMTDDVGFREFGSPVLGSMGGSSEVSSLLSRGGGNYNTNGTQMTNIMAIGTNVHEKFDR